MPSNTAPHPPRLCHITRSPDFNGYGFNLHTIKNKTGQFIGQVDEGSPAQKALLKEGDRIVEVNGVNIASENHKQVVSRIKLVPNETKLLVVDDQADKWYKEHNVVISSSLPEVVKGYSNKSLSRQSSTSSSEPDVKEIKQDDRRSVDSGSSAATSETSHRQGEESEDSPDSDEPLEGKVSGPAPVKEDDGSSSEDDDNSEESDKEKVLSNGMHEETKIDKSEVDSLKTANDSSEAKLAVVEITETPATDDEEESSSSEEEENQDVSRDAEDKKTVLEEVSSAKAAEKVAVASATEDTVSGKSSRSNSSSSASSRESDQSPPKAPVVTSKSPLSTSPSPPSSVGAPSPTPYTFRNTDGLNMNMSAAQMREYLASKKKKDIRHSEIDMRKKYEIIQKL